MSSSISECLLKKLESCRIIEQADKVSGNEAYGFSNEVDIHLKSSATPEKRCGAFIALWNLLREIFSYCNTKLEGVQIFVVGKAMFYCFIYLCPNWAQMSS